MAFDVAQLLRAAGGSLVGKVRMQKVVYLLDQLGMDSDSTFHYHYYGPYSADVTDALEMAIAFDEVIERQRYRASDGVPYCVFELGDAAEPANDESMLGQLDFDQARRAIRTMGEYSSTVLELAATMHWLVCAEEDKDWFDELRRRKGPKASNARISEATKLLERLGLPPAYTRKKKKKS